jgi:ankyrin repeat protein
VLNSEPPRRAFAALVPAATTVTTVMSVTSHTALGSAEQPAVVPSAAAAAAPAEDAPLSALLLRLSHKDKQGFLLEAVKRHNAAHVRAALAHGASPAERFYGDLTVAHMAAQWDSVDVLRALLAGGADHRWVDHNRKSMLSYAVEAGALATMRVLLEEAGAEVEARDRLGATPLVDAARAGQAAACALLLRHGADVHAHDCHVSTPAHEASRAGGQGGADALSVLLDAGARLDALNKHRQTPLMLAAGAGALDAVRALLAAGAEAVKPQDGHGNTALMHAIIGKPKKEGETPEAGDHADVAAALLPHSDLDARNCTGGAAVHIAALCSAPRCLALLLAATPNGASVRTARTHTVEPLARLEMPCDQTVAHIAADRGHHGVLKKVLAAGAARAAADSMGTTPLHYACMGRHLACITLLLGTSARKMTAEEVNAHDWLGRTPLFLSVSRGCRTSCAALLAAVADGTACTTVEEVPWKSPLDMARAMHPGDAPLLALLAGGRREDKKETAGGGGAGAATTTPRCDACGACAAQAPGGRLHVCSGCQTVYYCTAECQRSVWGAHKRDCKRVAAAKLRESELTARLATGSLL